MNTSFNSYTYNASGNLLTNESETWENGQLTNDVLLNCSYDVNGHMISFSSMEWQNSVWVPENYSISVSDDKNFEYFRGYYGIIKYSLKDLTAVAPVKLGIPANFSLAQNYPNPFNPSTIINYSIPKAVLVTIKVYDILGREVEVLVYEVKPAGNYSVQFSGNNLASGIYFYRMQAGSFAQTKKLLLLK
jgi:hypothetical protein